MQHLGMQMTSLQINKGGAIFMKRLLSVIVAVLGFAVLGRGAESVVTVRAIPPVGGLRAGQPGVLTLELTISRPFHINSDQPLESYLIPTTVRFGERPGVTFGKVVFPPALVKKLPFADKPMSIYEGTVRLIAEITPAPEFEEREVTIEGNVRYQACNDETCLPPTRASFKLTMPVSGARGVPQTPNVTSTQAVPTKPAAPAQTTAAGSTQRDAASQLNQSAGGTVFGDKGLLLTMLLVFAGGLALNLTPCVYPMIPITISYFGGQSQGKKGSLLLHSLLYVVGMAVTYSILGTVAALTGSLFGAALQYPPVLIGIALIMVVLALSMFDVYELQMPGFLNRLAGSSGHMGLFGTFFMGLTVGIVAAPCIGPFVLGLLTYVGNTGNALLGFTLFFILALGLGVPFIFLGIFSGSLSRLPRSGAWMIWVRKNFGFVLIGMAIYFLKPLFPEKLLYFLTFALIMLLGGIYMAWIEPTQAKGKGFLYLRNAVGLVFFGMALSLAVTGVRAHVDEAILKKVQTLSAGQVGNPSGAIQWSPYSDAKLEEASRMGKPVFVDFYADWCLPCKELDEQTFSAPEVISASKGFMMLKVDLTSADDPKTAVLQEKYQIKGVPTLVFLKPDGKELTGLRITGFEPKEVFLPKMDKALEMSGPQKP
jgi:thiol:disulfide interchange protein DsbD